MSPAILDGSSGDNKNNMLLLPCLARHSLSDYFSAVTAGRITQPDNKEGCIDALEAVRRVSSITAKANTLDFLSKEHQFGVASAIRNEESTKQQDTNDDFTLRQPLPHQSFSDSDDVVLSDFWTTDNNADFEGDLNLDAELSEFEDHDFRSLDDGDDDSVQHLSSSSSNNLNSISQFLKDMPSNPESKSFVRYTQRQPPKCFVSISSHDKGPKEISGRWQKSRLRQNSQMKKEGQPAHSTAQRHKQRGVWSKLYRCMAKSRCSQTALQDWDRMNGLPASHARSMISSGRSRRLLQEYIKSMRRDEF